MPTNDEVADIVRDALNAKDKEIADLRNAKPITTTPVGGPSGMVLQYEDNFETFDETKWMKNLPWMPDGGLKNTQELQLYQSANTFVNKEKQTLDIVARREQRTTGSRVTEWTSGCVCSGAPNSTKDARLPIKPGSWVEASVKASVGKGTWDAFWLLPISRAWPPEIDIFEFPSDKTTLQMHHHFGKDPNHPQFGKTAKIPDASQAFHVYGLYWDADKIVWYFDGVEKARIDKNNLPKGFTDVKQVIPTEPMYVIFNLAMGGWGGSIDPSLQSATMSADWFKLWTLK